MEPNSDKFWYVHSCDLNANIQIKIGSIDGKRNKPTYEDLYHDPILKYSGLNEDSCSDMYVECQVFSDGRELTRPVRTSYKSFTNRWNWNEWISIPLRICDLTLKSVLALTVYDSTGPHRVEIVGGTVTPFFETQGVFRQGMLDLKLWPGERADSETTPGEGSFHGQGKDQMLRLSKLAKKHHNGEITKVDWLDRLTFREIELINEQEKRTSNFMYLVVEFPRVEHEGVIYSIIYWELGGEVHHTHATSSNLVKLKDPEIELENLQERKHHRLVRSVRHGHKDDKPNAVIRDDLDRIMNYPPTKQLTGDEKDTVWRYRKHLSTKKKGLTKFLKGVNWKREAETIQALELMRGWAPPSVDDALELLGPTFTQPEVRSYAVDRLSHATDEDLLLYLLQLVQALKYESWDSNSISPMLDSCHYSYGSNTSEENGSSTGSEEAIADPITSIRSQTQPMDILKPTSIESECEVGTLEASPLSLAATISLREAQGEPSTDIDQNPDETQLENTFDLASFLISRATSNSVLANYLYWYLLVECEVAEPNDPFKNNVKTQEMYNWVLRRFLISLQQGGKESKMTRQFLNRQKDFLNKLVALVKTVGKETSNRMKRIEKLQSLLADPESFNINFSNFESLPLPLDPEVQVRGIKTEKATLFKSNLEPARLTFITSPVTSDCYVTIFKHGDDLRQDQLILQIITLMDRLLRRENLDLKLTPYKVLATSSKHGFIQFIESSTVAEVLKAEGTIQNYFKKHSPSENSTYGISPQVLDNYIKSCAGYCVISYLLGIGDRHLDNLLLTKQGNLFHIDFGYILGRDPKPLPPPMKLTKEMVDGMGGLNSEHYNDFRKLCYTAFHQLRRHANLILNLFSLMVDASVPDIALEPDKTVKKVEDKFRLDLDDEGAVSYMQGLIDDSVNAVMAAFVEQFHKFAQYMRK